MGSVFFFCCMFVSIQTLAQTRFREVPVEESHLVFTNRLTESQDWNYFTYMNIYNGGGISVGDLDGDQLPELFMVGNMSGNHLFRNKGHLQFEDVTASSGVGSEGGWFTATTMADVNGDGLQDLYVCRAGSKKFPSENQLWINKGNLQFEEQGALYGVNDRGNSTDAVFFDADNDGDLDLYVVNHPNDFNLPFEQRLEKEKHPLWEESDHLYIQNAEGRFEDATEYYMQPNWAFGLSVTAADFNNDGLIDLFVGNDFSERDFLWMNQGNGRFKDQLYSAFNHTSNFSMGSDAADFNNDGHIDLFVADMMGANSYRKKTNMSGMNPEVFWDNVNHGRHYQYMQNVLQMNAGNGCFSEMAAFSGTANTDWSWTSLFGDLDNDGWKDLLVTNGMRRDVRNNDVGKKFTGKPLEYLVAHYDSLLGLLPVNPLPNYIFRNKGDLTFENLAESWGVNYAGFSNGAVEADLDLDGDLDLVFNNLEDLTSLYENRTSDGHYLQVSLEGKGKNTRGIGAKVYVTTADGTQLYELSTSRGFLSGAEAVVHIGLGKTTKAERVEIVWPGNKRQILQDVAADQRIRVRQADALLTEEEDLPATLIHQEPSWGAAYNHQENPYDDYAKEVLLPYEYSGLGPSLAVGDVNGDGLEDFFVGGVSGWRGALFTQLPGGKFEVKDQPAIFQPFDEREDIVAVFFDADNDGDQDLYVGEGSNEWEVGAEQYRDLLYLNDGKGVFSVAEDRLPDLRISTGTVKPCDFDGDGDQDLFVGGRLVPGKYPYPAESAILVNNGGRFDVLKASAFPALKELGMVTDARWFDINKDGSPDLIVTAEWQPVRVFLNENGHFSDATKHFGLDQYTGWWYSLELADVNGDGIMDILAGNLGENSRLHRPGDPPLQVYAGDMDGNHTTDIVLSTIEEGKVYPVRGRQCSSQQVPVISDRFKTYDAFASATVAEIYGEELNEALHLSANWLESTAFLGRADGTYEAVPFPAVAQLSAVQCIDLVDVDRDGTDEIVLTGNLYRTEVETPRLDASVGVILKWKNGKFVPMPLEETGFFAYGDIKSTGVLKDDLGRTMIITAPNSGSLRLFRVGF